MTRFTSPSPPLLPSPLPSSYKSLTIYFRSLCPSCPHTHTQVHTCRNTHVHTCTHTYAHVHTDDEIYLTGPFEDSSTVSSSRSDYFTKTFYYGNSPCRTRFFPRLQTYLNPNHSLVVKSLPPLNRPGPLFCKNEQYYPHDDNKVLISARYDNL